MTASRIPTAVDRVADTYLDEWVRLDPYLATYFGVPGYDDRLPGLDPDWLAQVSALRRATLARLAETEPVDANDRITIAAMREELGVREELRAAGVEESDLKNLGSPLQSVRDIFDLMPVATAEDWAVVARRLAAVPAAIDGYIASLRYAAGHGRVRPQRQVRAGIEQCANNCGPDGFFATFAAHARTAGGGELPQALRADLDRGAAAAAGAYQRLSEFLRDELMPQAPQRDPVGRELYAVYSRSFLGSAVDLEETYEWGQQELAGINELMARTAERITPGASIREAIAILDADPQRTLHGSDAMCSWMQETSDAAVSALAGTHFDIPEAIRTLECRIAPTHDGVIYYTGPSDDLSRPGRMWWSVPNGVTDFAPWRERTTVYHEGVPGHHLQVAQTAYRRESLNRWRRLASWVSGHGEGWALYAERLMADLGFLDDAGDFLGMLDAQSMRAARVVLDIGIHCELAAPKSVGGGAWDYDKAWAFLAEHCATGEGFRRFELDRYLGWPGQAPAYKIGERIWLQLRSDAEAKAGGDFDLRSFHRTALDVGSVGLDVLRSAVLGEFE